MHKLADLVERDLSELATLEALDSGMLFAIALGGEVPFLVKALSRSPLLNDRVSYLGVTDPALVSGNFARILCRSY